MAIVVQKDPMGMGGRAWLVSSPADVSKLPREAASLVPPRVAETFGDLPASLARMAAEAPLAGMKRWIASLAGVRCELEVYATRHGGREARLRFHVAAGWTPSIRGASGEPSAPCPSILRQVHAVTGAIDYEFGCSGMLVALDELRTLPELVRDQAVMGFAELREILAGRPELRAYVGIYEADGDWLCADPAGRTLWTGGEWIEAPIVPEEVDVGAQLDRYFEEFVARRRFQAVAS